MCSGSIRAKFASKLNICELARAFEETSLWSADSTSQWPELNVLNSPGHLEGSFGKHWSRLRTRIFMNSSKNFLQIRCCGSTDQFHSWGIEYFWTGRLLHFTKWLEVLIPQCVSKSGTFLNSPQYLVVESCGSANQSMSYSECFWTHLSIGTNSFSSCQWSRR